MLPMHNSEAGLLCPTTCFSAGLCLLRLILGHPGKLGGFDSELNMKDVDKGFRLFQSPAKGYFWASESCT